MAVYEIKNEELTAKINTYGGELVSLVRNATGKEYIWNADEAFWKRSSPILFPFVGSTKNKTYTYEGVEYPTAQHGFARDMEFDVNFKENAEIWFQITETEETKKIYPFDFTLMLGYVLEGDSLLVKWKVVNDGDQKMYFSIGAHPAFFCPNAEGDKKTDCMLRFDCKSGFIYGLTNDDGLVISDSNYLTLDNGEVPIDEHFFDEGAYIIENDQTHAIALVGSDHKSYVTVKFDAPLVGIWSPPKKSAPFVCIEPWYGRCDRVDFMGELSEREWENELEPAQTFEASYTISVK